MFVDTKYYLIINFDSGMNEFMIGLFIDLPRAFDTISHKILVDKLYKYGIRGIALEWIKDYLLNRKQYVVYNNTKSIIS